MKHAELVEVAGKWLWKQKNTVVVTEVVSGSETPDAFGWKSGFSTLIECKATHSDFMADAKKPHRNGSLPAMGRLRYYLTPRGIIGIDELPDKWGLLVYNGKRVNTIVEAEPFDDFYEKGEIELLISLVRRIGANAPSGVSISWYTHRTSNKATLGISEDSRNQQEENHD